jgi:DNA-binding NtrC family response regulator
MTPSILLVHDDPAALRALRARFEQAGCEVLPESTAAAAEESVDRSRPDAVCIALTLAANELLTRLAGYGAPVVVFGESPSGDAALKALRAGASRVADSSGDLERLVLEVQRCAAEGRRQRVTEAISRHTSPRFGLESLGVSGPMRQLAHQIGLLAQSERTTLLLTGEIGVGKAWAARVIHDLGPRAGKPFFRVRLAGQSEHQIESLIFGHERGAFPEASVRRRGLLELADGGTVFLREIGDLPAELQPKLLRALETKTFRRMGGNQDIGIDTRLMVSTRRDLGAEVEAERFRQDLFYRLSVMPLALPPLRDRAPEDRHALLTGLHGVMKARYPDGPQALSIEAVDRFLNYAWPGNIHEMENVLERSMIVARGQITINVEHLPGEFRARPGLGDRRHTPMSLDDLEHQHIDRTLRYHGGNRTRAAKELGISRATLINKIKLYQITD